jgi:glucose-1-phosphate cytidylyltransferase
LKVVILAGGLGTRLGPETELKPKPMVQIGGKPILWHIMMQYSTAGLNDFLIALGYRGEVIKKYMLDYCALQNDLTIDIRSGEAKQHRIRPLPNWTVQLIDTGMNTAKGGRLRRISPHLNGEPFVLTWGDGVSDINLSKLIAFHRSHGKLATLTAVRPPARFGHLELDGDRVTVFSEKVQTQEGWINGGVFVLEPRVLDYIESDEMEWEKEPLERLAQEGQLMAYRHESFWQCMDTVREMKLLQSLWDSGKPPWQTWE